MLFHQESGWSHQRHMSAVLQSAQQGMGRHQCFARPHIPLKKAMHRPSERQISVNLPTRPCLV